MTSTSRRVASILAALTAGGVDLLVWAGDSELRWGGTAPPWVVPVLTAAAVGALLVRRRAPVAVFCAEWVIGLAGLVLPQYAPFACLVVALHGLAARRPALVAAPGAVAMVVPFGVDAVNAAAAGADPDRQLELLLANATAWAVLALAAYSLGRVTFAANRRAELLEELRARDAAQALQDERLRLARELHDVVTHAVTAMLLQAAGARALSAREGTGGPVGPALTAIETSGRRAVAELHQMLDLLRQVPAGPDPAGPDPAGPDPAGPDPAGPEPAGPGPAPPPVDPAPVDAAGVARIPVLAREATRMGLRVRYDASGDPVTLDPDTDLTAYRVVQEALTNAAKHAGPGAEVAVDLRWSPARLLICVTSTPDPHHPGPSGLPSSGRGLLGLTERVTLAGGTLRTRTAGPTFELRAELPTRPTRPADPPEPATEAAPLA